MLNDYRSRVDAIKFPLALVTHAMVSAVLANPEERARHEAEFVERLVAMWCEAMVGMAWKVEEAVHQRDGTPRQPQQ